MVEAMRRRIWRGPVWLFVFLLGILFTGVPVFALDVPSLTGRVVDLAHVLSAADAESLTASLKAHEDQTGNQVAVLIVASLEGALKLFPRVAELEDGAVKAPTRRAYLVA